MATAQGIESYGHVVESYVLTFINSYPISWERKGRHNQNQNNNPCFLDCALAALVQKKRIVWSSLTVDYDSENQGAVAELRTAFYVTFVIAVATIAAVMLTAFTVTMIFAINTVMMTTAAFTRCRRQVIN
jgi:hypothetical protein